MYSMHSAVGAVHLCYTTASQKRESRALEVSGTQTPRVGYHDTNSVCCGMLWYLALVMASPRSIGL